MTRLRQQIVVGLVCCCVTARGDDYQPAPPAQVPNYFAQPMPCTIDRDGPHPVAKCKGDLLDGKSLRELSILRNTIYARWGWDGYRKPWLKAYFHSQSWFKPNPKFNYKLVSDADRQNAHFIAMKEQSLTDRELARMRDDIFARHGKIFDDLPTWTLPDGKTVRSCKRPKNADEDDDSDQSSACHYKSVRWYKPDKNFSEAMLSPDEKIELGLIARAMGDFALDDDKREQSEASLDRLLKPDELRQLSLRDLRLLRNTIYAKRGRPFKSEILRDHFSGMEWYKPNLAYTDQLLTANDVRNIALIRSVENEFGGPLSDEDWLTEPATDGA